MRNLEVSGLFVKHIQIFGSLDVQSFNVRWAFKNTIAFFINSYM